MTRNRAGRSLGPSEGDSPGGSGVVSGRDTIPTRGPAEEGQVRRLDLFRLWSQRVPRVPHPQPSPDDLWAFGETDGPGGVLDRSRLRRPDLPGRRVLPGAPGRSTPVRCLRALQVTTPRPPSRPPLPPKWVCCVTVPSSTRISRRQTVKKVYLGVRLWFRTEVVARGR